MQIISKTGYVINKGCSLNYILDKMQSLKHFDVHEVALYYNAITDTLSLITQKEKIPNCFCQVFIKNAWPVQIEQMVNYADAYYVTDGTGKTAEIFDFRHEKRDLTEVF
jgi:hypothetical protein